MSCTTSASCERASRSRSLVRAPERDLASASKAPSLATTRIQGDGVAVDLPALRRLVHRHLVADELQEDLVLLQGAQEALGAPAGAVGSSLGIGHDQIVLHGSWGPADAD